MPLSNVAHQGILGLNKGIVGILSLDKGLLLEETLNFVDRDLTLHVTRDNVDNFFIS